MTLVAIVFWLSALLLIYAQVGYGLLLEALFRVRRPVRGGGLAGPPPRVSVIVPAYAEEQVIAERVRNLRALDHPADRIEVIVACDGSPDATADRAREAGADLVLELPRVGKVNAQNAAVARAGGELLAFSDANARWQPDALAELLAPFADPRVGYVCGNVQFVSPAGDNQEGLYWRYEMRLRTLESALRSVTAGNGAIYATRPDTYLELDGIMGHDLSFPFKLVKRGLLAVYAPRARAVEAMAPSIDGEFRRKRRMTSQAWRTTLRCGMLNPAGYDPLYALMIYSHRLLRYLTPFLHLLALVTSVALAGRSWIYALALLAQLLLLAAALAAGAVRLRPLLIARYYVATTAALACGLWDWLRGGAPTTWDPIQGTR